MVSAIVSHLTESLNYFMNTENLALIYALKEEVWPLLNKNLTFEKSPVIFWQTGVGMAKAHESVEKLIETSHPSLILSVGCAGATDPTLRTGDLVVPSVILSETPTDHFAPTKEWREKIEERLKAANISFQTGPLVTVWNLAKKSDKEAWHAKGVKAVDMETAAMIAVALKKRVPFVSLRVIFDEMNDELPMNEPYTNDTNPLTYIVRNPKMILQIPKFARMNRVCQKNLALAVETLLSTGT